MQRFPHLCFHIRFFNEDVEGAFIDNVKVVPSIPCTSRSKRVKHSLIVSIAYDVQVLAQISVYMVGRTLKKQQLHLREPLRLLCK